MTPITEPQKKAIIANLQKLRLMDDRAILIEQLTNGRTSSLRELTKQEAALFLTRLAQLGDPEFRSADRMRKKLIGMARELGWEKDGKADMQRLDQWCRTYSYGHKPLMEYEYLELPKLVSQFENMYREHFPRSLSKRLQ